MRITLVGTGTAAPHPLRVQSGVLVECGDVRLLIDCGSGVAFRLAQLGLGWETLTHVALTHFHADHCADLPTLVFGWRHGMFPARTAPVSVVGPPGTLALIARFDGLFHLPMFGADPPLNASELKPGEMFRLSDQVELEAFKVPHTPESVAYSVTWKGRRVVVSGDTGFSLEFAHWASGADLLLLECSLPAAINIPMHLSPEQCGELAAQAGPTMLALTHFYPPVEAVDIASAVRQRYGGALHLGVDGWSTTLEPAAAVKGTSRL